MENISGARFADLFHYEMEKTGEGKDNQNASIFSDLKKTFEDNPDGISNKDFMQFFNDRYDLSSNQLELGMATAFISSLDNNNNSVSLQDIGTYLFSTNLIEASGNKDYNIANIKKMIDIVENNTDKSYTTVDSFVEEVKNAIDIKDEEALKAHIKGVFKQNESNILNKEDLEELASVALDTYDNLLKKKAIGTDKTDEVRIEEPKEEETMDVKELEKPEILNSEIDSAEKFSDEETNISDLSTKYPDMYIDRDDSGQLVIYDSKEKTSVIAQMKYNNDGFLSMYEII